jgi:RNase P/RNase MRP subunit p29
MPSYKSDLVDISGEVVTETEKAYRFYDGKTHAWLPKISVSMG